MDPIDLSAFTGIVSQLVTALTTYVPTVLGSAAVIGGGLLAFRVGWRVVRQMAK